MFWSVWGAVPPAVMRAGLAGAERRALAAHKLVYPGPPALDLVARHVYWPDAYLECVERADYEGKHRTTVLRGYSVSHPSPPASTTLAHVCVFDCEAVYVCGAEPAAAALGRAVGRAAPAGVGGARRARGGRAPPAPAARAARRRAAAAARRRRRRARLPPPGAASRCCTLPLLSSQLIQIFS